MLIVEGIKKCLKTVQTSGALAVVSAQGITVWHDIEHRKATKGWRPHPDLEGVLLPGRRLYVGFDGGDTTHNVAVIHAEARVAQFLMDVGLDVRLLRIPFPPGKKAGLDDFLAAEQDPAAALHGIIESAIPADPRASVRQVAESEDRGGAALHLLGDLSFAASLAVGGEALFDVVAAELQQVAKVSKRTLAGVVESFRAKLRAASQAKRGSNGAETSPAAIELRQAAESLLRDPGLVCHFQQAVKLLGLIGEEDVALTILLSAVSRKMPRPIHVVVKSASSAGKNYVVGRVVQLAPPDDVVTVSDLSPHALHYIGNSLKGKVVVVVETVGAERAEYPLRVMMSEGELVTLTAEKVEDEKGCRFETQRHVVEGPMAVIMTTTRGVLHGENETRILELNLDESVAQTERIMTEQARAAAEPPGPDDVLVQDRLRKLWRTALAMLAPRDVVIPQAPELIESFPRTKVRARRDFAKLIALVQAHALLHQFQRPVDDQGRVIAVNDDVQAALRLGRILEADVPPRLRGLADQLLQAFGQREFSPPEASKLIGYAADAVRRLLRDLEGQGLVELVNSQRGSLASTWRVVAPRGTPTKEETAAKGEDPAGASGSAGAAPSTTNWAVATGGPPDADKHPGERGAQ